MRVIGLTGGMASGKSLVLQQFMQLGAYTIDCDVLSREAVIPCSDAWWAIVRRFGTDILKRDLELDRAKLREIVFHDVELRKALELIIHPEVTRKMRGRIAAIEELAADPKAIVVVDVPLLIETGMQDEFESVIVVYVSETTQIRRVTERDRIPEAEAQKLIALQLPLKAKLPFADHVISNEGSPEATEQQVRTIFKALSA
jgi:dephospho-CoA kinase